MDFNSRASGVLYFYLDNYSNKDRILFLGDFFCFWNLFLLLSPSLFGHCPTTFILELRIFYYLLGITVKVFVLPYDPQTLFHNSDLWSICSVSM